MKKKHKTYLLLAAVIAIWGTIALKLYSHYNPAPDEGFVPKPTPYKFVEGTVKSYPLYKLSRDPFTGRMLRPKQSKKTSKTQARLNNEVVFPLMHYKGFVSGNNKMFVISIQGIDYVMKRKDSEGEVTLLLGNSEEVVIKYKGKRKTIRIQE